MASPKTGRNVWTQEQRHALHILNNEFELTSRQRADIFNAVFDDNLKQCAIHGGLAHTVLESQYRERFRTGPDRLWADILAGPQTDAEEVEKQALIKHMREEAATLGIALAVKKGWKGYAVGTEGALAQIANARKSNSVGGEAVLQPTRTRPRKGQAATTEPQASNSGGDGFASGASTTNDNNDNDDREDREDIRSDVLDGQELDQAGSDEDEEADEEEAPRRQSIPRGNLEMLHSSDTRLDGTRLSVATIDGLLIDHDSLVYKYGGEVSRVMVTSINYAYDFMICNELVCTKCFDDADETRPSQTEGLPFVHFSETIARNLNRWYKPMPYKIPDANFPENFNMKVVFIDRTRNVKCKAKTCDFKTCKLCIERRLQGRKIDGLVGLAGREENLDYADHGGEKGHEGVEDDLDTEMADGSD